MLSMKIQMGLVLLCIVIFTCRCLFTNYIPELAESIGQGFLSLVHDPYAFNFLSTIEPFSVI